MKKSGPPKLQKFPPTKQRRLDRLLEKNSEGGITPREHDELQRLVLEVETLMVENAKRLAGFVKKDGGQPTGAVPVTVWVQPQS